MIRERRGVTQSITLNSRVGQIDLSHSHSTATQQMNTAASALNSPGAELALFMCSFPVY